MLVLLRTQAVSSDLVPYSGSAQGTLRIKILDLPSSRGVVKVSLYRSREAYASRRGSFRKAVLPISGGSCEWLVDQLPYGEYAAMFYHDQNANGVLDRNRLGMPVEAFGFSNNARPRLGPPPYERVRFELESFVATIEIRAHRT